MWKLLDKLMEVLLMRNIPTLQYERKYLTCSKILLKNHSYIRRTVLIRLRWHTLQLFEISWISDKRKPDSGICLANMSTLYKILSETKWGEVSFLKTLLHHLTRSRYKGYFDPEVFFFLFKADKWTQNTRFHKHYWN